MCVLKKFFQRNQNLFYRETKTLIFIRGDDQGDDQAIKENVKELVLEIRRITEEMKDKRESDKKLKEELK